MISKQAYKGCRDFFPPEMRVRQFLTDRMHEISKRFGYQLYDGPLLEEVELYKAKSGEEIINEQIYSFTDRGGRFVAIRPEMTPTLARMISQIYKEWPKPLRWYSIPNLFRYEKPQRGRVREHWQWNVDIFGAEYPYGEIEIINIVIQFLQSFGATEKMFHIYFNDRVIVDQFFQKALNVNAEQSYKLYKVLDRFKKVSYEQTKLELQKILGDESKVDHCCRYLNCKNLEDLEGLFTELQLSEYLPPFKKLVQILDQLHLSPYCAFDPSIVRGLDYYTGFVFEVFDLNPQNPRAIAGGGSYANLLKIFNENSLPAVGLGLGDVTLLDFLKTHHLLPDLTNSPFDLLIAYSDDELASEVLTMAQGLRNHKYNIEIQWGKSKLSKIFKMAQQKGFQKLLFCEYQDGQRQWLFKNFTIQNQTIFQDLDLEKILGVINGN